jgi:hypothetical protein
MSLFDGKAKLTYAAERLALRWSQAQEQWNDPVSREFERSRLARLEPHLRTAQAAIDRLAELINRVERDCT